eukprot:Phypoly_transcript_29091.p1 GENE.Phypoly_transcript_29091~~Phypoly_transcript_29091.p1  ORF type:complete len:115 (+),score=10.81 Phypoly_transcript_29091:33-347(+)
MDSHFQQPFPMYHNGTWVTTHQGWIQYLIPQYYSPAAHTTEGMQDSVNLHSSYHENSLHPPMYISMNNYVSHIATNISPTNLIDTTTNEPCHQSYTYVYSLHGA